MDIWNWNLKSMDYLKELKNAQSNGFKLNGIVKLAIKIGLSQSNINIC